MGWFKKHKVLTVILTLVLLAIIGGAAAGNKTSKSSQPAAADKPASVTTQPTSKEAATPQVLLDLSGSGTKQTQQFTAAGNWDLTWSYDCSAFAGGSGNFIVTVYNGNGSVNYDNSAVNQLGASGSDVQHYYKGGTFYLSIDSECSWHVTAKG